MKSSSRTFLLGLALLTGSTSLHAKEEIYFVSHALTLEEHQVSMRQLMFSGVSTLPAAGGGHTLRTRLLWSRQSGGGNSKSTLDLDPEEADAQATMAVLDAGFELQVDNSGRAHELRAVDQKAWRALLRSNPRVAAAFASPEQALGLRPMRLPAKLRVGQTIVHSEQSKALGKLEWRMQVKAVTDEVAVLQVELHGDGLQAHGRQALRRSDGMPLEAQLTLTSDVRSDGTPAMTQQLRIFNMAGSPSLDLLIDQENGSSYTDAVYQSLHQPPFSAASDDPSHYRLYPQAEGELESWMLSTAALAPIEASLGFVIDKDSNAGRPLLRIAAQFGGPRDVSNEQHTDSQVVMAKLRGAELLDRRGQPLPDITAVPVLYQLAGVDRYQVSERQVEFPMRLPVSTRAEQLQALDTIRLSVAVETFAFSGAETVAKGKQSSRDTTMRIAWLSPQRVSLQQDRPPPSQAHGDWITAIPLDAQGHEIPAAHLTVGRSLESSDTGEQLLEWEHGAGPLHVEVASAKPIASLRLRHFRWEQVPRQWDFHNATALFAGGYMSSVRQMADDAAGAPPAYDGRQALARVSLEPGAATAALLRINAGPLLAQRIQQVCRVVPIGPQPDRIRVTDMAAGSGAMGWSLQVDGGVGSPTTVPLQVSLQCPESRQRFTERVDGNGCFEAAAGDVLSLRPICRSKLVLQGDALIARDAQGQALAPPEVLADQAGLRFKGKVAELDYDLIDDRWLRRDFSVPHAAGGGVGR